MSKQAEALTPEEFKKRLEAGEIGFIFDLRAEDQFKNWKIEAGKREVGILNIPQEDFVGEEDRHLDRFPRQGTIATVCAHGDSAQYSADLLMERGFDTVALKGGMDAWSEFYETHVVNKDPLIYQIYRVARGCITHVIISGKEAVVIDAIRHIDNIKAVLDKHGARPVAVLDTHLQADHISGGVELARAYGAPYYISAMDAHGAAYPYERLRHDTVFKVGTSTLKALHTPGHTPGSVSLLLDGRYFFSGDTVMETSIGRPDLGGMVDRWAGFLYYTLFTRLSALPDSTIVLPTHAASLKEQDAEGLVRFTLGEARRERKLFALKDKGAFTEEIKSTLLTNPDRYADIRKVNLGVLSPEEDKRKELEIGKNLCGMAGKK